MLCLDISNIAIINVKGIAYFLQFWRNWLLKVLCLKIVDIYKMHIKEINIKIRVFDYFDNLIKVKKLETKSVLSDRKNYKDLVIYFTIYDGGNSIWVLFLYYNKLMGPTEEHERKNTWKLVIVY